HRQGDLQTAARLLRRGWLREHCLLAVEWLRHWRGIRLAWIGLRGRTRLTIALVWLGWRAWLAIALPVVAVAPISPSGLAATRRLAFAARLATIRCVAVWII